MASRGVLVTQVTPQLIRFANGLAARRPALNVGNSLVVWNFSSQARTP